LQIRLNAKPKIIVNLFPYYSYTNRCTALKIREIEPREKYLILTTKPILKITL